MNWTPNIALDKFYQVLSRILSHWSPPRPPPPGEGAWDHDVSFAVEEAQTQPPGFLHLCHMHGSDGVVLGFVVHCRCLAASLTSTHAIPVSVVLLLTLSKSWDGQ